MLTALFTRLIGHVMTSGFPQQSERRRAEVIALANEVFGDPAKAERGLSKPKSRFHGKSPLQVAKSKAGARQVTEMLWQIDEGMFG